MASLSPLKAIHSILLIGAATLASLVGPAFGAEPGTAPPSAPGYIQSDGAIQIVGTGEMAGMVRNLNELFRRSHPGPQLRYLSGNDLSSLYSLVFDATAFAPVTGEFPSSVATSYRIIAGAAPFGIRLAHASLRPEAKISPVAVIVHPGNPLEQLSASQVAHIFTTGGRQPDLTHWEQLGASGPLAAQTIHPCGLPESDHFPSEDLGFGDVMFLHQFDGANAAPSYEPLETYDAVVKKVAEDPSAIGLVALNRVTAGVKAVAIGNLWSEAVPGTAEAVAAGRYPYDRFLYIYVRRQPGKPLPGWLCDYLRLALSPEGQQAIAEDSKGYLPLNAREVADELFKLQGLAADSSDPKSATPAGPPPDRAPYVQADGAIYVAGNDLVAPFLEEINRRFQKSHPDLKFRMNLQASSLAISGLTSGKSAFGPMGRDATFADQAAFTARYGYPPTDVVVGWDNTPDAEHFPPGGKNPPAVWVNSANPVPALTWHELAAILTTGAPGGDITHWGQISGDEGPVGANGADWAKRAVHVYLPSPHGLPVLNTTRMRLGGRPWTSRVEFLPSMEDVMNAVGNDPFGIGFIGWWPDDEGWDRQPELGAKVRIMPLAGADGDSISHGGSGDLYPTAGAIHLFVNRAPGKPLDPWLVEYLRLVLSKEGQELLASHSRDWGFIPLDPGAIPEQLAKIE